MEVSVRESPAQAESKVSMLSGPAHNKPEVRTPKRPAHKESGIRVREELFCQSWWTARGEELFCLTRRSPCRPVQRRPHQYAVLTCLSSARGQDAVWSVVWLYGRLPSLLRAPARHVHRWTRGRPPGPSSSPSRWAPWSGPSFMPQGHLRKIRTFIAASFLNPFIRLFEG